MNRRVVITGMGVVSSVGIGIDKFWPSIKEGKNGIRPVTGIDVSSVASKVSAQIPEFDPLEFIEKKELRRMDRFIQFAMAAAKMATQSSKIDFCTLDGTKTGVIMASGIGGIPPNFL